MPKNILVVDDDPSHQKLMESVLTSNGYDVSLASDGSVVSAKIANKRPDLIIMDYMMPQVDGAKATKEILQDNDISDIPIVFLTSMMTEDPQSGQKFDVQVENVTFKTLSKPVDTEKLLEEIASLLS